jgi:hypothetical protein
LAKVLGDKTKVQVNVKGSFKSGSFGIDLTLIQGGLKGITSLFNSDQASAAATLLQILGFIGLPNGEGLIALLLKLRNRKIKRVVKQGRDKTVIEIQENNRIERIETHPTVIALFSSVKIRSDIQKFIRDPLSKEGVENFTIKKANETTVIKDKEKEYFKLSDVPDEPLEDQVREVYVKALSVIFIEGNKWRFSDGTNEFYASVKDEQFVNEVQENKITFTKDDIFKVKLREKQWISDTGIKTEHEIEEVIDYRSAAKQIKLPFDND